MDHKGACGYRSKALLVKIQVVEAFCDMNVNPEVAMSMESWIRLEGVGKVHAPYAFSHGCTTCLSRLSWCLNATSVLVLTST